MDETMEVELTCDCHKNLGLFLMPKDFGYINLTESNETHIVSTNVEMMLEWKKTVGIKLNE